MQYGFLSDFTALGSRRITERSDVIRLCFYKVIKVFNVLKVFK